MCAYYLAWCDSYDRQLWSVDLGDLYVAASDLRVFDILGWMVP